MAGTNLCVTCAQLPRKDRSLAMKTMSCPECKTTFGVTSYGAAFRIAETKERAKLSGGMILGLTVMSGIFTMMLVLVGMGLWSIDLRMSQSRAIKIPPPPPDELRSIPEVAVDDPFGPNPNPATAKAKIAGLVTKIKADNQVKQDHFLLAQMERRKELRGLPFVMGDACRMKGNESNQFENSVQAVREGLERDTRRTTEGKDSTGGFWNAYHTRGGNVNPPQAVAALTQMLAPERTELRASLVQTLAGSDRPEATKALARMAIFDVAGPVRQAALAELKKRPKDHPIDDVLMHGIRHPMSAVAHRTATAIIELDRKDLMPQLAQFLDQPAPGDPEKKTVDNKEVCEVREVVRINHHRNCLLCHPPAGTGQPNEVPGVIPTPGNPFPTSPKDAYGSALSLGDPMVRADTTYLRQDFSVMMPVSNAAPWPEMQRFDFIVRSRVVEGAELATMLARVKDRPANFVSENHKAAVDALRRLSGRDAAPNAAAWQNAFKRGNAD